MSSCNLIELYTILLLVFNSTIAFNQNEESIVFPTTFLERQKAFELLSNNADTNQSVVQLSRAAEAFSLEYFQVDIRINVFEIIKNYFGIF